MYSPDVTALTFKTAIDDPGRFDSAKTVGAYFGLTPKRWQSGETIDRQGRISKQGDKDVRRCLFEAAHILLVKYRGRTPIKTWGERLMAQKGHHKATVAVARAVAHGAPGHRDAVVALAVGPDLDRGQTGRGQAVLRQPEDLAPAFARLSPNGTPNSGDGFY